MYYLPSTYLFLANNFVWFFRKPKLEGAVKEHIQQANIDENYAEKILDGKDMDAFNKLVSSVAHKLKKPLEEIKSDFSVNRRRVKNRSSAKNSRIGRNSRLEKAYEVEKFLKRRLERKKLLTKMISVSIGNLKIIQIVTYQNVCRIWTFNMLSSKFHVQIENARLQKYKLLFDQRLQDQEKQNGLHGIRKDGSRANISGKFSSNIREYKATNKWSRNAHLISVLKLQFKYNGVNISSGEKCCDTTTWCNISRNFVVTRQFVQRKIMIRSNSFFLQFQYNDIIFCL